MERFDAKLPAELKGQMLNMRNRCHFKKENSLPAHFTQPDVGGRIAFLSWQTRFWRVPGNDAAQRYNARRLAAVRLQQTRWPAAKHSGDALEPSAIEQALWRAQAPA